MIFKKFFNKDAALVEKYAQQFDVLPNTMYLVLSRVGGDEDAVRAYLSSDQKLLDPFGISGMQQFCDRIKLAKQMQDKILIFGDYDVDGISATAIMLKTLKKLGIDADFYLPNRYVDGYGLTKAVIDKIEALYAPELIITVDCGISCAEEVEYAKEKGIEVIVTDHHEIPERLPDTLVLNAKIKGQKFGFTELCGCGLAYKISEALLGQVAAEEFLPIAAIATIADIVSLTGENRNIVKKGFKLFSKLPLGLKQLLLECGVSLENPNSTDIAFKIAPKINASGRMGDARDSLMLYLCQDMAQVQKYLAKIKVHNTKRQELSGKIMDDCEKAIQKMDLSKTRVICLASKKWDQGILGIACARLVEKYNRPVFLFSASEDGILHGSGRSITDINIHEILSSLGDILETFGGHTMAAGLTLKREKYEEFSSRVNAFVFEKVSPQVFIPIKYYDLDVSGKDLSERFLRELELLEPFGCDNSRPRFKITSENIEFEKRRFASPHAEILIDGLKLTYFNFAKHYNEVKFSRRKSFIFEYQGGGKNNVVSDFDMGSYIVPDAHMFTYPVQYEQLMFENDGAKISYYPQEKLLSFVANGEVFGTAFVAYSAYDFVHFLRTFSKENIYHVGIFEESCVGYNSLLLSPTGTTWAKNFKRIVFLSPLLDEGFASEISKISGAEILLPMQREVDMERFEKLALDRTTFATIFKALAAGGKYYSLVDFYNNTLRGKVGFDSFYVAQLVFRELGILGIKQQDGFLQVWQFKGVKKDLSQSPLYNKLLLLQQVAKKKVKVVAGQADNND